MDSPGSPLRTVKALDSLAPDGRVESGSVAGRHARLEATFARRGGRTVLARAYVEPPFRIGRTFSIDDAAYVIVVCSGPGVFGGDRLYQRVRVERGARVVLTSQSALQAHPSTSPRPALFHHSYVVEDDAELHCHWDPVIPFAGAWLDQRYELQIAESARLYWSDALMSGRAARGERWRFHELAHELRLTVSGSLAYRERYRLSPDREPARRWLARDADYLATALVRHGGVTAHHAEELQQEVDRWSGGRGGVDLLEPGLILARFMSRDGIAFSHLRAASRAFVLDSIFNNSRLAGRKSM